MWLKLGLELSWMSFLYRFLLKNGEFTEVWSSKQSFLSSPISFLSACRILFSVFNNLTNIFVFRLMSCEEWRMMTFFFFFFHSVHMIFNSWSLLVHINNIVSLWGVFPPQTTSLVVHPPWLGFMASSTFFNCYCWEILPPLFSTPRFPHGNECRKYQASFSAHLALLSVSSSKMGNVLSCNSPFEMCINRIFLKEFPLNLASK